jgi:hypothetical protein
LVPVLKAAVVRVATPPAATEPVPRLVVEAHVAVGQLLKVTEPPGSDGSLEGFDPVTVALSVVGWPEAGVTGEDVSAVDVVSVNCALPL